MKNSLIILILLLFNFACAYEKIYIQQNPFDRAIYRPVYNPYSYQTTNYNYLPQRYGVNHVKRNSRAFQKAKMQRKINRIKRYYNNNRLSLFNNKGTMTGYSTPINQDVYKQLGINPNDIQNQKLNSPNCTTDLFSSPKTNYDYNSSNTLKERFGGGVGTKTGVTIIYD